MKEFKKEIINTLKEIENKIVNKLSLQEEKDKNISLDDVTLLLQVAKGLNIIIDLLGEQK